MLPNVLILPFAGMIVDRIDQIRLLLFTSIARFGLMSVAFSFINICYSGIIAVLIPWLFKVHHSHSPVVYGVVMASSGVGAMLGAFVYGARKHWKHRGLLAYLGALTSGLALLLLSIVT